MPRQPRIEYEGAIYHVMIVEEGLKAAGWSKDQLERERKGHPAKVKPARRLRGETTKTLKWIAQELYMGIWTHVSHLLYRGGLND